MKLRPVNILVPLLMSLSLFSCDDDQGSADYSEVDYSVQIPAPASGTSDGAWDPCEFPQAMPARPVVELPEIPDIDYNVDLMEWGIYSDGTHATETTQGLQGVIDQVAEAGGGYIHLPTGTYLVGIDTQDGGYYWADSIRLRSGTALVMDETTTLKLIESEAPAYCVVSVGAQEDVAIIGGTIEGDRMTHDYNTGSTQEESHAVCVDNLSSRVLIDGVTLRDAGGDGVLILGGSAASGETTSHVTVRNCDIDNNRRQGISVVGGSSINIENNHIHNTRGTAPQFGIDIEGQGRDDHDIIIRGNRLENNRGGGVVNCSGRNVWIEENVFDETENEEAAIDGGLVYWSDTNQVVQGNTFIQNLPNVNGRWMIITYSNYRERTNPYGNFILDNTFQTGGLHMMYDSRYVVRGNHFTDVGMLATHINCLELFDNEIEGEVSEAYKLRYVKGYAQNNQLQGEALSIPMDADEPFTNSDPSRW